MLLQTKSKPREGKFYKQLPPGSFPLATIISFIHLQLCLLKNILSLKKIIHVPKFSKGLALAADNLCYYFKAKKEIHVAIMQRGCFPISLKINSLSLCDRRKSIKNE